MKNKLIDLADIFSKTIRWLFYLGLGCFLAWKGVLVVLGNPTWPNWMAAPIAIVALAGGWLLSYPIADEPTPKERREAKAQAERLKQWLKEMDEQLNDGQ